MHPTQQVLEAALVANPDDLAAHSAYADFLSEQGDPRGEYIQIQLRLEQDGLTAEQRNVLKGREHALFDQYASRWFGELHQFLLSPEQRQRSVFCEFRCSRGWLESLQIPYLTTDLARALLNSRALLKLLRRLNIADLAVESPQDVEFLSSVLLKEMPVLPALREFTYRQDDELLYAIWTNPSQISIHRVLERMPNVEVLRLGSPLVDLHQLFGSPLPRRLRQLDIANRSVYPLDVLAANPSLAQLTHLILEPPVFRYEQESQTSYLPIQQTHALLESKHLVNLTHLHLRASDFGDAGCQILVESGLAKTLKVLDLERGSITDQGAAIFARCHHRKNLERLNLTWNRISAEGLVDLQKAGIRVQAPPYAQFSDDADPRQHLFDDIME